MRRFISLWTVEVLAPHTARCFVVRRFDRGCGKGVCGYTVIPDYGEDSIQVIVVLDIDYIKEANTKPGFVARMIREGVKQEIKKWLGLDVYVGSTAKKCNEPDH